MLVRDQAGNKHARRLPADGHDANDAKKQRFFGRLRRIGLPVSRADAEAGQTLQLQVRTVLSLLGRVGDRSSKSDPFPIVTRAWRRPHDWDFLREIFFGD